MLLILIVWTLLLAAFAGVGSLAKRLLGSSVTSAEGTFDAFWIGWACMVALLQLLNFILPLRPWGGVLLLVLGAAGLALVAQPLALLAKIALRHRWAVFAVWAAFAALIALRATGPLTEGDSGEYHLGAVEWAASHSIVPGLGNLMARLAFNHSFFLYAAMLDLGPFLHNTHQLVNGLLLVALIGRCLLAVFRLLPRNRNAGLVDLYFALMLAPALNQINDSRFFSLMPDPALFALGVVLVGQLLRFIPQRTGLSREPPSLAAVALLASTGLAVKASFAGIALAAGLFALLAWLGAGTAASSRVRVRQFALASGASALVLLPWLVRGALLSGYPLFPSTLGALPVAWRMPAKLATNEYNWIYLRARNPNVPVDQITQGPDWLKTWLTSLPNSVTKPLEFSAVLALFAVLATALSSRGQRRWHLWGLAMVPAASLVFWFVTAPSPRFAGAAFWILLVSCLLLVLSESGLLDGGNLQRFAFVLAVGFFLWVAPLAPWNLPLRPRLLLVPTHEVRVPDYAVKATASGVELNVPTQADDYCWNIPLPCTTHFNAQVDWLVPGKPGSGFRIAAGGGS